MTKKDLERRNDYLLLQLKIINQLVTAKDRYEDDNRIHEIIGKIMAVTDSTMIKDNINFIEKFDKKYNFYDDDMTIEDYK